MRRKIVTIHLPLDMGATGKILERIGEEYPDATVTPGEDGASLEIVAEDPPVRGDPPEEYDFVADDLAYDAAREDRLR